MKILNELAPGQKLEEVRFLRRYKRFLVDVERQSGEVITVHNPNTGSMKSCLTEGCRAVISWKTPAQLQKSKAKLPATLELLHSGRGWIGVNTMRTNGIVRAALEKGALVLPRRKTFRDAVELISDSARARLPKSPTHRVVSEPSLRGQSFRPDFYWEGWLLEVKNVTQISGGYIQFPDAVSVRGAAHMRHLGELSGQGYGCAVIFVLSRPEGNSFRAADEIDPEFSAALRGARDRGLVAMPVRMSYGLKGVSFRGSVALES